ncbi:MAG TPA: ATP-binding protein [Gemmatimonadaceae bacterium]|nr:ATP-binding protein [Gemmatimonadaceae bacterium]
MAAHEGGPQRQVMDRSRTTTVSEAGRARTPAWRSPAFAATRLSGASHIVQLCEDEAGYVRAVAGFVGEALARGHPALVVATEPHRAAVAAALLRLAVAPEPGAGTAARLTFLDARGLLDAIMVDGRPNRERFLALVGATLRECERQGSGAPVYVHGEMVDLLCASGAVESASRLETLWNELARRHSFHLFCTYSAAAFGRTEDGPAYDEICGHHTHVLPSARYDDIDEHTRQREMARLEQRALALASELALRRRLEDELRDVLAERERLLEREREARQDAEAANRAKSDFLAVMSHELRTPLNAIGGYAELIELGVRGPVTAEQREDLARIRRSQLHLLGLINEVLNYTRIESGAVVFEPAPVDIGEVVASVEPLVRQQIASKGLALAIVRDAREDDPLLVRADRDKVQQILLNLLSNAMKFTGPGGRIEVAWERAPASPPARDGRVMGLIRVRDSGIGIPAEKLGAVFEPFVQVGRSLATPQEGTGLGLAISRDLARGMGGELTAESVPGAGSTFTLALPIA